MEISTSAEICFNDLWLWPAACPCEADVSKTAQLGSAQGSPITYGMYYIKYNLFKIKDSTPWKKTNLSFCSKSKSGEVNLGLWTSYKDKSHYASPTKASNNRYFVECNCLIPKPTGLTWKFFHCIRIHRFDHCSQLYCCKSSSKGYTVHCCNWNISKNK